MNFGVANSASDGENAYKKWAKNILYRQIKKVKPGTKYYKMDINNKILVRGFLIYVVLYYFFTGSFTTNVGKNDLSNLKGAIV